MRGCLKVTRGVILQKSWMVLVIGPLLGCASHAAMSSQKAPALSNAAVQHRMQASSNSVAAIHEGRLTLDQAIQEALAASSQLEQIGRRINAAAEQINQAEAAFYPRIILSEDFNVTDNPVYALMNIINQRRLEIGTDFNNPGQQQNFSTRIQGEWSIFEGGSRWFNRSAAIHQQRSVEADLEAARQQLVATITETYYRWLQALGFIGVAEGALEAAQTDEKLGEARLQAEVALPSEIYRLKTHRTEAEGNLVTARTSARRLQAAMERLLARPIGAEEIPTPDLSLDTSGLEEPPEDTTALVEQALEQRPELAAVKSLIEAARERVRSAKGNLLPRFGIQSGYQWDSESLGEAEGSWMVGIQATWPLFQGGLTVSKIREAQFRLKEMEARGEELALDIALEVHQAALAVEEAAEKIRVAGERRQWALEGLEETRNLYKNEVVTVDALLQADVAWNRAEVSYTAALFDGKIAQALLRRALGEFAGSMEVADE
jgi:outer membrane protein